MKKYFAYIFSVLVLASCQKNISDINSDPKAPVDVPGETLVSNALVNLAIYLNTPSVNVNNSELIMQYWAETTYISESEYDFSPRHVSRTWWQYIYTQMLQNFKQGKLLIGQEIAVSTADQAVQKNKIAETSIMEVYTWLLLVNTFGNVPYSKALDYTNTSPVYDDQKTVFYALADSLTAALGSLDAGSDGLGSADLIYGGTTSAWQKFGNSILLRMGMQIADSDPTTAAQWVSAAITGGTFTSNADNASFIFSSTPPNCNPIWVNLVQSKRNDFVPTSVIVDTMNKYNDPRLPLYFLSNQTDGSYLGGVYGSGNNYTKYSHTSDMTKLPTFPAQLLDYAEVEFLLAEAASRGMSVTGTAESHYDAAVTASIEEWGGSAGDAATYLAQPDVAWGAADWKSQIGVQQWIAYYTRGFDAWTAWRRLDKPVLTAPGSAVITTGIPVRLTYPDNEALLNKDNLTAAQSAIGGDEYNTKLFWDKF